ncbi:copper resistance CopC/CopD family protein [Natronococcus wangiae]|uniref:copper resistance CopC/CopD family protein n=1 Tax=Natronococcus wangiae TaxID=3068275 RepID=UPI00273D1C49|nr:FixH family protein [Natronococcus sp. AD5]
MSPDGSLERGNRPARYWTLAVLAVALLVLASVATPVAAHAYLSDSDPANGEQLESLPDEITLQFSGDGVQVADVAVIGPDGEDVSGDAGVDPDDSQTVRAPLEEDAGDGMYTVEWEILADDGHTVTGSFFFSVGDEPLDRDAVLEAYEDDESADESVSPIETASKGLLLIALVGLVGVPATAAIAVYPVVDRFGSSGRTVDRRLAQLLAGFGALLFAAALALGLARAASLGPLSAGTVAEFVGTPLGRAWLVQLGLAALLAVVLAGAAFGRLGRRVWLGAALVGALCVGATVSWTSHSATAIDRLQGTAIDFAHVAGAGLWIGGLVVLSLAVPPLLRDSAPDDRAAIAAGTIRRYSLLALAGVTLAGASGLVLAAWHVPGLEALGSTLYGVALSTKTLLVLLALGLGGFTRVALLRHLESPAESGPRGLLGRLLGGRAESDVREDGGRATGSIAAFVRAVRFEVGVLVLVLLLSGLLTSVPTAAVVGGDDGPEIATIEREGDVDVELTAVPASVDDGGDGTGDGGDDRLVLQEGEPVVLEVAFSDGSDEPLESDRTVRLLANSDAGETFEVDLEETEDGTYATVRTLPADGDWELRVTGEPDGEFVSEWFDAHVASDDSGHDRGDGDHEHGEHDGDDREAGANADSPFATVLRLGSVVVAVIGSVAVALEAVRFRDRER